MKVAVCISGQPRNYEQGYLELKKWFLDRYDCDVYIHTWYDTSTLFKTGHNFSPNKSYTFIEEDYQNILELYKPKFHRFQRPIIFDSTDITSGLGIKLNVSLANFYSIQASYNLIAHSNIKYDLVIRTRFDLQFTDYISPECIFLKDITKVNPNTLNYFAYSEEQSGRLLEIDDLFAVSSPKIMKTYCDVFPWILYYLFIDTKYKQWIESYASLENPIYLVNESLLKWHLLSNHIELNPISSLGSNWTPFILR